MDDDGVFVYKGQEVKVRRSRFHRIEDHNFWIDRIGKCPYCHSGSKPVHSSLIDMGDGGWKVLDL